jgi:pimeloyl-ACP methyl ester carboxylesterase
MSNPTFVLVHGAWHGGWSWKQILPVLRAAGYDVYAPTQSGCGDRSRQISPEVTLTTHIEDTLSFLYYEDLTNVVLVGHSYGGFVISGVIERARERISHAIWLDAFVPDNGESIASQNPDVPLLEIAASTGEGYRVPCIMSDSDFGMSDPIEFAWTKARLTDQPLGAFLEPIAIDPGSWTTVQKSYILTSPERFPEHAERARARGYTVIERTSWRHNAMATHPHELAEILISLTASPSPRIEKLRVPAIDPVGDDNEVKAPASR